jgi:hypothetical protein
VPKPRVVNITDARPPRRRSKERYVAKIAVCLCLISIVVFELAFQAPDLARYVGAALLGVAIIAAGLHEIGVRPQNETLAVRVTTALMAIPLVMVVNAQGFGFWWAVLWGVGWIALVVLLIVVLPRLARGRR